MYCYPVQFAHLCPKLPAVTIFTDKEFTMLKYKGEMVRINTLYFQKLEQLYRYNCYDDKKFENYLSRVWCLLKRYQVIINLN